MIKSLNTNRRGIAPQKGASSCSAKKKKRSYPCLIMPANSFSKKKLIVLQTENVRKKNLAGNMPTE